MQLANIFMSFGKKKKRFYVQDRKGQAGSGLMKSVRGSLGLGETGSQLDFRKFPGSGLGIQALDCLGLCFCVILKMQNMYVCI